LVTTDLIVTPQAKAVSDEVLNQAWAVALVEQATDAFGRPMSKKQSCFTKFTIFV